jgi:multidrug efflux pump
MRRTLGTAVFAGMIGVTLFGIFLTPVFYFVVRRLTEREAGKPTLAPESGEIVDGVEVSPVGADGHKP